MPTNDEINYVATDLHRVLDNEVNKLPSFERVMIPSDLVPHLAAMLAKEAIVSLDAFRSHQTKQGA